MPLRMETFNQSTAHDRRLFTCKLFKWGLETLLPIDRHHKYIGQTREGTAAPTPSPTELALGGR